MTMNAKEIAEGVELLAEARRKMLAEMQKVVIGQEKVLTGLLAGVFSRGHCLLVGVPGLAKTLMVSTLASILDLSFKRIQFTPDLMPSDITGTDVLEETDGRRSYRFLQGPIFANIVLADEINRTPPKTQAALLEAMQERQVTVGQKTNPLPDPFFVVATQNPIEQEGTYPLPEAQIDRFMLKIRVDYPTATEEKEIMERVNRGVFGDVNGVVDVSRIESAKDIMQSIHMEEKITDYIVNISRATRNPDEFGLDLGPMISYGASPRASIWLGQAARAHAFLNGRGYVTPQDVKSMAPDVLRHRIILSYEAEAEGKSTDDLISIILERIEVP